MSVVDLVIRGGTVADGTGGPLRDVDVAVSGGKIVALGKIQERGREEVDARGLLVTPGFVDVHTHYDAQLMWSERLAPSSDHGVTTIVTGNCGVGFAPCRPADRSDLIRLMEGVEDIPEAVMAEGLPWNWLSFPEFLTAAEARPHNIDFAVLLPHSPLRVFTMGKRALDLEPATASDRTRMRTLARDAMQAGAIGFGTSRNVFHKASNGDLIPSMTAEEDELREIALGLRDAGRGVIQAITMTADPCLEDYKLLHRVAEAATRPLSYTLLQANQHPEMWRDVVHLIERDNASGANIKAQIYNRPQGAMLGLELTLNPFSFNECYRSNLAHLPLAQRVSEMRKPEVRSAVLQSDFDSHNGRTIARNFDQMYRLDDPPNYEPDPSTSIASIAASQGVTPDEIVYDFLLEDDGRAKFMVASFNYFYGNLDSTHELLKREDTILALGDGGAHYGVICDASYTTYTLTHWVRDRVRGGRIDLPTAVRKLTSDPAKSYGFRDRGYLAPGMKADINIIDFSRLNLKLPTITYDLPARGKRLTQGANGYVATFVSGTAIQRDGADTFARPGHLVRNAGQDVA